MFKIQQKESFPEICCITISQSQFFSFRDLDNLYWISLRNYLVCLLSRGKEALVRWLAKRKLRPNLKLLRLKASAWKIKIEIDSLVWPHKNRPLYPFSLLSHSSTPIYCLIIDEEDCRKKVKKSNGRLAAFGFWISSFDSDYICR